MLVDGTRVKITARATFAARRPDMPHGRRTVRGHIVSSCDEDYGRDSPVATRPPSARSSFVVSPSQDMLERMLVDERGGTRVWTVWGSTREELLGRVSLIFAEHIHDDDEVHIAYNAMQSGWQARSSSPGDAAAHTELFFEYSALIVIRRNARQGQRELTDAIRALVARLDCA